MSDHFPAFPVPRRARSFVQPSRWSIEPMLVVSDLSAAPTSSPTRRVPGASGPSPSRASTSPRFAGIGWGANPAFGAYLARAREDANLSLRAAAGRVGISHTYLAQMEQYEMRSAPPMELLAKLAKLYGLDEREVQHEAGYRYELPGEIAEELADRDERQFRRLLLHDLFRPEGFTEDDLAKFPPAVWRTVVELARKVDANARASGSDLAPILSPHRGGK